MTEAASSADAPPLCRKSGDTASTVLKGGALIHVRIPKRALQPQVRR
ncbi:hypothetical protein [Pseudomonas aeruginosa]|nr:hypothetical protein [Pseudomonas aeruginosa]MDM5016170.1 hypothetical protein [Pseudomonas aeruginosa]